MSLKKWFYKNGFGSVGHSAKTTCDVYATARTLSTEKLSQFFYILDVKSIAWSSNFIFPKLNSVEIINASENCLAVFSYCITFIESNALQDVYMNNLMQEPNSIKSYNTAMEAIYEVVKSRHPREVEFSLDEYKIKVKEFSNQYFK